jgi:uncharacterized protein with HEPN domain
MSRDYKVYLEDIAEAMARIQSYLSGLDWSEASKDSKTFDAVIRNLEIIGEAVKNLPAEFKESEPSIEWRKISGFRDILAHQYFGIDGTIIGDVVRNKLPGLEKAVNKALEK